MPNVRDLIPYIEEVSGDAELILHRAFTQRSQPTSSLDSVLESRLDRELVDRVTDILDTNIPSEEVASATMIVAAAIEKLVDQNSDSDRELHILEESLPSLQWAANGSVSTFPHIARESTVLSQTVYDWVTWRQRQQNKWLRPSFDLANDDLFAVLRVLDDANTVWTTDNLDGRLHDYVDVPGDEVEAAKRDAATIRQLFREMRLFYPFIECPSPPQGGHPGVFTLEKWLDALAGDTLADSQIPISERLSRMTALREVFTVPYEGDPGFAHLPAESIYFAPNIEQGLDPKILPVLPRARRHFLDAHNTLPLTKIIDGLVDRAMKQVGEQMPWMLPFDDPRRHARGAQSGDETTVQMPSPEIARRYITTGALLNLLDQMVIQQGWPPPGELMTGATLLSRLTHQPDWQPPPWFLSRPLDVMLDPVMIQRAVNLDEASGGVVRSSLSDNRLFTLTRMLALGQQLVDAGFLDPQLYDDPFGLRKLEKPNQEPPAKPTALQLIIAGTWYATLDNSAGDRRMQSGKMLRRMFRENVASNNPINTWTTKVWNGAELGYAIAKYIEAQPSLMQEIPALIDFMSTVEEHWPLFENPFDVGVSSQPLGLSIFRAIQDLEVAATTASQMRATAVKACSAALGPNWLSSPLDENALRQVCDAITNSEVDILDPVEITTLRRVLSAYATMTNIVIPPSFDNRTVTVLGDIGDPALAVGNLLEGLPAHVGRETLRMLRDAASGPGQRGSVATASITPAYMLKSIRKAMMKPDPPANRARNLCRIISSFSRRLNENSPDEVNDVLGLRIADDDRPSGLQWLTGTIHGCNEAGMRENTITRIGGVIIGAFQKHYGNEWVDAKPTHEEIIRLLGEYVNDSPRTVHGFVESAFIRGLQQAALHCDWTNPLHVPEGGPMLGVHLVLAQFDLYDRGSIRLSQLLTSLSQLRKLMAGTYSESGWRLAEFPPIYNPTELVGMGGDPREFAKRSEEVLDGMPKAARIFDPDGGLGINLRS